MGIPFVGKWQPIAGELWLWHAVGRTVCLRNNLVRMQIVGCYWVRVAVGYRLGFVSLLNSHPYFAIVGNTIDTVTSVLTQRELDSLCSLFNISIELRPDLPDRNATIKDSPAGKIGMYTRLLEFANFRVPLSKFLLCVLEYYRINLAQLSVIGAAKVSHFELMCRVLGRVPTVGTFRRFYVNSISNGWLSFSKRSGAAIPCCYSKNLDSLKNWNNRFFWIDAFVCPLSVPWFNGVSVVKDPLPLDDVVDLPCVELLNENRTLIRTYPEIFLCVVGLSRSYLETNVRPTFLHNDDEEMGLLDFVESADPFKVNIDERTLADNAVPLLEETKDKVISPSAEPLRLVDHTIKDELKANTDKRKRKVVFDAPLVKKEGAEFGTAPHPSKELVSSFVTPTPEPDVHEDSGETPDVNVQTRRVPERFVVTTSSSEHGDTDVSLRVKSPLPHIPRDNAGTSAPAPGEDVYVPEWNITNDARIDNLALCRDLLDHITPPRYWAALRNQTDAWFLDAFNINSAQHVCMVSEPRLRYEYETRSMKRFQEKFTESSVVVQQRDAKIAALKARLERSEKESAELSGLRGRVLKLETEVVAKSEEVAYLNKQNAELLGKVSALESVCEKLSNQVSKMHRPDALRNNPPNWMPHARIADVRRDMDTDLYPHMLNAIAGGDGFLATTFHGKAGRSLAQVKAYDHDVESKYVAAVNDFKNVSFSLLEELEALKDSPLAPIMSALTLDGDVDSIPRLHAIPVIREHAERRGLVPSSNSPKGGVTHTVHVQDSSLGVADYQVSTLVHTGDTASVAPPHDDLFDTTVLDGPANP
ncbi:hypothetical protein Tco_0205565 [Tanacetum coccineum]